MRAALLKATVCSLLLAVGVLSLISPAGAEDWKLIQKDEKGNLLFIDMSTLARGPDDKVKVCMKFESGAENSPMIFLDEIDCAQGKIRRLEVTIHSTTCSGSGEPLYHFKFEGKWDSISEGLEEALRDTVCEGQPGGQAD
jgi:hypothetical protein